MSLSDLERWYATRCNGDWEHQYGISIETLDNPGWRVKIDLRETPKAASRLGVQKSERSENDWMQYWTEHERFQIACGPLNLSEAIDIFLDWFKAT